MHGLIVALNHRDALLAGRTERSMRSAGVVVCENLVRSLADLAERLGSMHDPVLIMRSGSWLTGDPSLSAEQDWQRIDWVSGSWSMSIPGSATGRPLVAIGSARPWLNDAGNVRSPFARILRRTGGDFARMPWWCRIFPEPVSIFLEPTAAHELGRRLIRGASLATAARALVRDRRFRAVHVAAIDFHDDAQLRVVQLVTTLQIGGAERVALDLADELNRRGHVTAVAALGYSTRLCFSEPRLFFDLSHVPNDAEDRAEAVAALAIRVGVDVIHAHLISGGEAAAIKRRGLPLVMTVHNLPESWPAGLATRDQKTSDLILACSKAVERSLENDEVDLPLRTVWNGIDPRFFAPSKELETAGRKLREQLGWSPSDLVIAAVANPRRQKRLDRLPKIVHALARLLQGRRVRLLLAGAATVCNADAQSAVRALEEQMGRWLEPDQVHWSGAWSDIRPVLYAADLFVSVSAFEGLSLAHLEALASGLPLITTAVGGAPEVARLTKRISLVDADASAAEIAEVIAQVASQNPKRTAALPPSFTRYVMTKRTRSFYPSAIVRSRWRSGRRVWLITNNFSTGGAQSSARRLLVGLRDRGVPVVAITIQEQERWPTIGRRALMEAGVPCVAVAPPANLDPHEAVAQLMEHAAWESPRAIFFWNVITSYKVLLAESLLDTPIYDVSPGSMYFRSLTEYFAMPRHGIPCLAPREYGKRLSGVVVKYSRERRQAEEMLGCRTIVIPNGVPERRHARRHGCHRFVVGTAARLSPDKRLEDLIDAFRLAAPLLPPHLFRIAGGVEPGNEAFAKALRRQARGLSIEWVGELPDLERFYSSLDLFAMISEPAGCPNASLEAMAAGLPVIATDHGGASEQVIDGTTGRLVPRFDGPAFAQALVDLALNPEMRREYGMNASRHVRARFSMERMIDRYYALCFQERPANGNARQSFPLEMASRPN